MFNIPTVTKNLLLINIVVFLLTSVLSLPAFGAFNLNGILGLHFWLAPDFHFYQLFTYMFAHGSFMHLFMNMFALWMFGRVIESSFGSQRFLIYYLFCGIGAAVFQEVAQTGEFYAMCYNQVRDFSMSMTMQVAHNSARMLNLWTTVGASGSVYGILLAFGMLYPDQRIFVFPFPVPIKAKWFVCMYAVVELYLAFSVSNDGVAHIAHLGGMVFGYFLIRYWRRQMYQNSYGNNAFHVFSDMKMQWQQRVSNAARERKAREEEARSKAEAQAEIDRILDKIRRSGYESLTLSEKKALFDAGRK